LVLAFADPTPGGIRVGVLKLGRRDAGQIVRQTKRRQRRRLPDNFVRIKPRLGASTQILSRRSNLIQITPAPMNQR
jgi:hypothetical protein